MLAFGLPDVTSLAPEETNPHTTRPIPGDSPAVPPDVGVRFRHSGWRYDRELVHLALQRTAAPAARVDRFALCGRNAWVLRSRTDPDHLRVASTKCHDRWCRPCQRERAARIAANLRGKLLGGCHRFVTLSLRSSDADLPTQLDRLHSCLRCLRRSAWWSTRVTGGAAFIELTRNAVTRLWHPHVHLIVEGKYLPQGDLSRRWLAVTGDSPIVDVRLVRDDAAVARYVAKYLCKAVPAAIVRDPASLDTAMRALKGRRTMTTFGAWRGFDLDAAPPDQIWDCIAPLADIIQRAHAGDAVARQLLAQLRRPDQCQASLPVSTPPPRQPAPLLFV